MCLSVGLSADRSLGALSDCARPTAASPGGVHVHDHAAPRFQPRSGAAPLARYSLSRRSPPDRRTLRFDRGAPAPFRSPRRKTTLFNAESATSHPGRHLLLRRGYPHSRPERIRRCAGALQISACFPACGAGQCLLPAARFARSFLRCSRRETKPSCAARSPDQAVHLTRSGTSGAEPRMAKAAARDRAARAGKPAFILFDDPAGAPPARAAELIEILTRCPPSCYIIISTT